MMRVDALARLLAYRVAAEGGATVAQDGELLKPSSGYAVALPGYELVARSVGVELVREAEAWLAGLEREGVQGELGVWRDERDGAVYFDVSELVQDREEAVRLGRERGQLAVWDFASGSEVRCGELVPA